MRFIGKPFVECKDKAAEFYNNILPSLTSAISQLEGMIKIVCVLCVKTLKEAKYHLRLTLNLTNKYYQHSQLTLISGVGQGSTNSQSDWFHVSNHIFKYHQKQAHSELYTDPEGQYNIYLFFSHSLVTLTFILIFLMLIMIIFQTFSDSFIWARNFSSPFSGP